MVIDFENRKYFKFNGIIHINPANVKEARQDLLHIEDAEARQVDEDVKEAWQQVNLDDHVVMHMMGVIMVQQYSIKKGIQLLGERG